MKNTKRIETPSSQLHNLKQCKYPKIVVNFNLLQEKVANIDLPENIEFTWIFQKHVRCIVSILSSRRTPKKVLWIKIWLIFEMIPGEYKKLAWNYGFSQSPFSTRQLKRTQGKQLCGFKRWVYRGKHTRGCFEKCFFSAQCARSPPVATRIDTITDAS